MALFGGRGSLLRAQCQLSGASASTAHGRGPGREAGGTDHPPPHLSTTGWPGAESSRRGTGGRCGSVGAHPDADVSTYLRPPTIDRPVDNLPLLWGGNDPATMRGLLHGECCSTPSWPALHHFRRTRSCPSRRRLGRPYGQAQNRSLSRCRRPSIGRRGQSNPAGLP